MTLKIGKAFLLIIDTALLVYWIVVIVDAIPQSVAFKDYTDPMIQAWNWSFFPLDLAASAFGYLGLYLVRVRHRLGWPVLTVGLTFTFCAGFMAISFWSYYRDFSLVWWLSNSVLMIIPLIVFSILVLGRESDEVRRSSYQRTTESSSTSVD